MPSQIVGDAPEAAPDGGWIEKAGVVWGKNQGARGKGVGTLTANGVE